MKSEYRHEIEKRLRERGFKPTSYINWTRDAGFVIVFKPWAATVVSVDGDMESDINMEAEIWLKTSTLHSDCFLARERMYLTDELIEKKGYAWIDEIIQDLYKYAYDILAPKVKIAAEAAITGIESIA